MSHYFPLPRPLPRDDPFEDDGAAVAEAFAVVFFLAWNNIQSYINK